MGYVFFIVIHIIRLNSVVKSFIFQEIFNNSSSDAELMESKLSRSVKTLFLQLNFPSLSLDPVTPIELSDTPSTLKKKIPVQIKRGYHVQEKIRAA